MLNIFITALIIFSVLAVFNITIKLLDFAQDTIGNVIKITYNPDELEFD